MNDAERSPRWASGAIFECLRCKGREDTPRKVSKALSRLKNKRLVESRGHSRWAPTHLGNHARYKQT